MTDKMPIKCSRCDREVSVNPTAAGKPRPPVGWTNIDGARYWCGACWDDVYVPRAVTVGLHPADWDAFRAVLKETMGAARSLANWAYGKLLAAEPPRDPSAKKMPKKPSVYLYGLAREHCPWWGVLPASLGNAVLSQVESDYAADRYEVVWTGAKQGRNYTYPTPIPIPAQCWKLAQTDDGYTATMTLASGQKATVPLAVRKHQARILDRIIASPLIGGACKVIESRSYADRDKGQRDPGNGARFSSRVRLMISYYAPKEGVRGVVDGEWRVSTGSDSLLSAVDTESHEVWRYNADHVARLVAKHSSHLARLSRLSDDRKAETRRPRREARPRVAMLDAVSERDRNRMRSACHEISVHLINAAKRRKIARIVYEDKDHSFAPSFPWAMLRTMVDQKARAAKIAFIHANGSVPKQKRQPLETT